MEELADKIKAMLSDPEGVERIMGIARALGEQKGLGESKEKTEQKEEAPSLPSASLLGENNPLSSILNNPELKRLFGKECQSRNTLLRALCPFLSEEKREKLQRILQATSAIETVYSAGSLFS